MAPEAGADPILLDGAGRACAWDGQRLILPLPVEERVAIFGGGHCALALLLRSVGFREAGVLEEAIQSVHTPIGTAIRAVVPEKIAVSITGGLIYGRALRRDAAAGEMRRKLYYL